MQPIPHFYRIIPNAITSKYPAVNADHRRLILLTLTPGALFIWLIATRTGEQIVTAVRAVRVGAALAPPARVLRLALVDVLRLRICGFGVRRVRGCRRYVQKPCVGVHQKIKRNC